MAEKSMAHNAVVVGAMTFVSRVGGLVREVLMAYFFGAGVVKSAFDVAYRIPNLFRRLFGEGALSAALIPVYTETLEKQGKTEADRLASAVAGAMVALLGVLTAVGFLATFPLARHWGADGRWGQIMPLLRIMLPYAPLICLAALIMGVLNSLKSFAVSALAPAFQNLCCIAVLVCVCPFLPGEGLLRIEVVAWSILVSGVVQVAVQLPVLRRYAVPLRLAFSEMASPGVRRVFKLMAPMALAAGVMQVNVCLDSILAMWAGEWGPSALGYADRLVYLPLAIVGTAFATVLLPTLSSFSARADYASFADALERTFRNVIVVMTPAAAGLIVLSTPIISLVYETGAFDALSTTRTANALIAYSAGLVAAGLHKVVVSAYYARQDAHTPVVIGTAGVALNLAMNVFFIWVLPVELKPVGIAIATSISSFLSCVALMAILARRRAGGARLFRFGAVVHSALASLVAASLMAGAVCFCNGRLHDVLCAVLPLKLALATGVAAMMALGAAVYGGAMFVLSPSAVRELVQDFRHRRGRKN